MRPDCGLQCSVLNRGTARVNEAESSGTSAQGVQSQAITAALNLCYCLLLSIAIYSKLYFIYTEGRIVTKCRCLHPSALALIGDVPVWGVITETEVKVLITSVHTWCGNRSLKNECTQLSNMRLKSWKASEYTLALFTSFTFKWLLFCGLVKRKPHYSQEHLLS